MSSGSDVVYTAIPVSDEGTGSKKVTTKARRDSARTMRGGGPRLMCSPYFVGAALILLSIVSLRYWSVSTQNAELLDRIDKIQTLMKTE